MSSRVMSSTASDAPRLKKPSWRDPRLLLGLVLVLGSVAGVVALVDRADQTTDVYAAARNIPVGSTLSTDDLTVIRVRLGNLQETYLTPSTGIPKGAVATSLLREGELVSRADLGTPVDLFRKPVGLRIEDPLPSGTGPGARVDVWAATPDGRNGFGKPQMVLEAAEISELTVSESALGATRTTEILVLVEDPDLPALLGALANQAKITVVLNPAAGS